MSLKKRMTFYLLIMPISVLAMEVELEGISILGDLKTAYISLDGNTLSVAEGESIQSWTVERIVKRSVFLRNEADEIFELPLQSRLVIEAPKPDATSSLSEKIAQAVAEGRTVIAPPPPKKIAEGVYQGQPFLIEDKDIPPGYYRKRTPFGDYLIKE